MLEESADDSNESDEAASRDEVLEEEQDGNRTSNRTSNWTNNQVSDEWRNIFTTGFEIRMTISNDRLLVSTSPGYVPVSELSDAPRKRQRSSASMRLGRSQLSDQTHRKFRKFPKFLISFRPSLPERTIPMAQ